MGKTRTLELVVQPLTEAFLGPENYGASAQLNHAAQNFGPRGRILHFASGLLFHDSFVKARLKFTAQIQEKLDRRRGPLATDIVDEVGAVGGELLHADALRANWLSENYFGILREVIDGGARRSVSVFGADVAGVS